MKDIPIIGPDAVWYVGQNHMDEVIWQGLDAPNTVADNYAVLCRCHIANFFFGGCNGLNRRLFLRLPHESAGRDTSVARYLMAARTELSSSNISHSITESGRVP